MDRHRIRYVVLEDGSVEVRTDGGQREADANTDVLYRDDEGYELLPQQYIKETFNKTLEGLGAELRAALDAVARIHTRINQLHMDIAVTVQKTGDARQATRDFQLVKVSREMMDVVRTDSSSEARKAQEVKQMMAKLEDSRRAHQ